MQTARQWTSCRISNNFSKRRLSKGRALDKMVSPPIVADSALKSHGAPSLVPNGVTYVPASSNVGAKALYQVNAPIGEMSQDIQNLQLSIREGFFNDLFDSISRLQTVRSATEVDAIESEKLIQLGPVVERNENDTLSPTIRRVFRILESRGVLPQNPLGQGDEGVDIRYTSILAEAQRALGLGSMERFAQVVGNLSASYPSARHVMNPEEFLRTYGDIINVPAAMLRTRDEVKELLRQEKEAQQQEQAMAAGQHLVGAAQTLAATEVGAGAAALQ